MRYLPFSAAGATDPFLARAAALAVRAEGRTAPNPLVGCVITSGDHIVGEGFHHRAGEPHAEVLALASAGPAARGGHAFVTLEPCAHHGKTPPCADALIAAGITHVTIGMADPHRIAAGGADRLRAAGIHVSFADDPAPFEALNEGWLNRVRTGVPFVTAKVGMSLDARTSFEPGVRASMTGPSGREVTRRLRSASDAVLVSAATVTADDPVLTVRDSHGVLAPAQPLRVVLARREVPPPDAQVFTDRSTGTVLLASDAVDAAAIRALPPHVAVVRWRSSDGLASALRALGDMGVGELLVEPGPRLFSALWEGGLLNQLVVVTAGGCAGAAAPALYVGRPDGDGAGALRRRFVPVEAVVAGDVTVTAWRPVRSDPEE